MRPPRRRDARGSGSASWLLCASLLAVWTHGAVALCLGSGCPNTGALPGITTLYRRVAAWRDYTEPLAVLQLGRAAGALHFLSPQRGLTGAAGGLLAVGDNAGSLLLLSLDGQLVAWHKTGTASPVTVLASYRFGHNATVLVTGHANGELRLHTLLGLTGTQRRSGGSWEEAAADEFRLSVSLLLAIQPEDLLCSTPAAAACGTIDSDGSSSSGGGSPGACQAVRACAPITSLDSLARGGTAAATIVAADSLGRLAVLKHGGPTGLGARVVRRSAMEQVQTAVRPTGSTAAVLGSSGAASQQLSMPVASAPEAGAARQQAQRAEGWEAAAGGVQAPAFKACRSLGGSSIVAAAFDMQHSNRAYAVSSNGSVLALVVGGERGTLSGCTVRSWAPLPTGLLPLLQQTKQQSGAGNTSSGGAFQQQQAAVQLAVLPGYLVIAAGGQVAVVNITAAPRGAPRLLLHQPLAALAEPFGVVTGTAADGTPPLLAASRQGQHAAVMLNASVLALYRASFPYQAPRPPAKGALPWMQVLQPLAMVGVAVVVLAKARARRGGGDGSDFGLLNGGGRGGLAGDPRLREFERLLQNPLTAGATARQRHRPWGDGSDSETEASGGRPRGGKSNRSDGRRKDQQQRGGGGGGGHGREARWRRAATTAADDDADIAALRAELAGGSGDEDMELDVDAEELQRGSGGSGAFGSILSEDADAPLLGGGAGRRGSDDLSQLRQRLGQARIS